MIPEPAYVNLITPDPVSAVTDPNEVTKNRLQIPAPTETYQQSSLSFLPALPEQVTLVFVQNDFVRSPPEINHCSQVLLLLALQHFFIEDKFLVKHVYYCNTFHKLDSA